MATTELNQNELLEYKNSIRTRPSTIAAKEFFQNGGTRDWKSLPQRCRRLAEALDDWNMSDNPAEVSYSFSINQNESRQQAMTAAILVRSDPSFLQAFYKWFRRSLLIRQRRMLINGEDNLTEEDEGLFIEQKHNEFIMFDSIQKLGWMKNDSLLQQPLSEAIYKTILTWVKENISSEFQVPDMFNGVVEYKDKVILPWLEDFVGPSFMQNEWNSTLDFAVSECFCFCRIDEMFEIVAEYPDSHSAVVELKKVLDMTKMHQDMATSLKTSLTMRLNHPGANTQQIIDVYVNVIKVLREIDKSDRLLQDVAEPVRSYLRQRENTVRCIISSLTDAEAGGDLYEELRRQDARPLDNGRADSDDEDNPPDMNWIPPPPLSQERGRFLITGDILSMLVSIYGSKDLFVDEFRMMLADKLLSNTTFETDKDLCTLELLKLRFGEISMRNCEIMIKDIDDSKRIVSNIHDTIKSKQKPVDVHSEWEPADPVIDAAIISHIFWPTLQNSQFRHHARIKTQLEQFSNEYGYLKNPRRLVWMNQLGTVQIELDVVENNADGTTAIETREFSCTPLLATLISHFEDKDRWTLADLSNETGLAEHIIQKKLSYWVNNRVLRTLPGKSISYEVATRDYLLKGCNDHDNIVAMVDEDGNKAVSMFAHEEEEMELYESYIVGMLTNLGSLGLSRIHEMLKMYVSGGSDVTYSKSPQQLALFLQHLCKEEKLERGPDGMYKIFKK